MKNTLVIGASINPERYSYKAIQMLLAHQHVVFAIGNKEETIMNVKIHKELFPFKDIDIVTLYINKSIQPLYYDYIIQLKPKRVIFNPGTENSEFEKLLHQANIEVLEACTLVLLSTKQFE